MVKVSVVNVVATARAAHVKLTSVVGRLMAETGKMKTYSDAIEALLSESVVLSQELLDEVECFIKDNPQMGYATKEEFIQDAVRTRLTLPSEGELRDKCKKE